MSSDPKARARLQRFRQGVKAVNVSITRLAHVDMMRSWVEAKYRISRASRPDIVGIALDTLWSAFETDERTRAPALPFVPVAVSANSVDVPNHSPKSPDTVETHTPETPASCNGVAANAPARQHARGAILWTHDNRVFVQFAAKDPRKDDLKNMGFRYDGNARVWSRSVEDAERVDAMLKAIGEVLK